ncbi:MAG: phosphatase PAP2 family protein [Promethearchaeota archaeon]
MKSIKRIIDWDKEMMVKFNGKGGTLGIYMFNFFSFFGRETIWFLTIAFFIFVWYDPRILLHVGSSFLNGLFLVLPIKRHINRARPFEENPAIKIFEIRPTSRSFPSWHAYNVFSQSLTLRFLMNSPLLTSLFLLGAFMVSFSRIVLGAHYPSDVIIGALLGVIGFFLTIYVFAPLFSRLVNVVEAMLPYEIQKQQLNSWIFNNPFYSFTCVIIFSFIILSYFNKKIMNKLFKK